MHPAMFYLRFGAFGEVHIVNMGPGKWVFSPTAKTVSGSLSSLKLLLLTLK